MTLQSGPTNRAGALPPRPCPRCSREAPVQFKGFKAEHLKMVGWEPYRVTTYVNLVRPVAPA